MTCITPANPTRRGRHLEGGGETLTLHYNSAGANRPATFQAPAITEIYKRSAEAGLSPRGRAAYNRPP